MRLIAGTSNKQLAEDVSEILDIPLNVAFNVSRTFKQYRKNKGTKTTPMPDFYIGAHAATEKLTLLTRDPRRYRTYFPEVRLIVPD